MRELKDIFSDTLFLGAGRGMRKDENRLWMIAEHLQEGERALAFLSLKTSNLLLTERRLLELKPHLDIEGMWNVLSFKGYDTRREVYLREVLGFYLESKARGENRLRLQVGDEEVVFPIPVSETSKNPKEDLEAFGDCLGRVLRPRDEWVEGG
ncbi:MAG: hypothetical protein LN412_07555 [Candidatus Thermoplasmatota archaeon]|nr:hypothetical protein [Candidatus Thermoplasmatota archaeon]